MVVMKKRDLRAGQLLEMLRQRESLTVEDTVELMGISEATARRLFSRLEEERKLIRFHGGVRLPELPMSSYSFLVSSVHAVAEKQQIGEFAATLVRSGESIFIDAGTTTLRMAEALAARCRAGEVTELTVVSNSLAGIVALSSACRVILLGGECRPDRFDLVGGLTRGNLEKFRFDCAFFGLDAASSNGALMTTDAETAEINALFIRNSTRAVALADAEKFERTSLLTFATLEEIDAVITDRRLPEAIRGRIESCCKLYIV